MVDDSDYEVFGGLNWRASKRKNGFYVVRHNHNKKIYLHREILGAPKGVEVDHRDGNGLNNLRRNLRLATRAQNSSGFATLISGKTSRFRGVSWDRKNQMWLVTIRKNYKKLNLGRYEEESVAARVYDAVARKLFGEFACPNFP